MIQQFESKMPKQIQSAIYISFILSENLAIWNALHIFIISVNPIDLSFCNTLGAQKKWQVLFSSSSNNRDKCQIVAKRRVYLRIAAGKQECHHPPDVM